MLRALRFGFTVHAARKGGKMLIIEGDEQVMRPIVVAILTEFRRALEQMEQDADVSAFRAEVRAAPLRRLTRDPETGLPRILWAGNQDSLLPRAGDRERAAAAYQRMDQLAARVRDSFFRPMYDMFHELRTLNAYLSLQAFSEDPHAHFNDATFYRSCVYFYPSLGKPDYRSSDCRSSLQQLMVEILEPFYTEGVGRYPEVRWLMTKDESSAPGSYSSRATPYEERAFGRYKKRHIPHHNARLGPSAGGVHEGTRRLESIRKEVIKGYCSCLFIRSGEAVNVKGMLRQAMITHGTPAYADAIHSFVDSIGGLIDALGELLSFYTGMHKYHCANTVFMRRKSHFKVLNGGRFPTDSAKRIPRETLAALAPFIDSNPGLRIFFDLGRMTEFYKSFGF